MRIATAIVLLSLIYGSATGFVFSCEEVKYKLVNQNLEESTQYICVVPEEGFSFDQLRNIYAQVDKVSTSFFDIANSTNGCIERVGAGPWRIVADIPVNLDCSQEFSLIFTSSGNEIVRAERQTSSYTIDWSVTIVAPRTGIRVHKTYCTGNGDLTVSTGAGGGVAEFRYPMKSWKCADFPDWIVAFDNVITISSEAGTTITVDYSKHDYTADLAVSSTDRLVVMSSGRSDNLQNLHPEQNVATFSGSTNAVATADISSSFDSRYDGSVTITGDNSWTKQYRNESLHAVLPAAQKIKVAYGSKTFAAQDLWDSQDNFVVELKLNQPVAPATKPAYCSCELDKFFLPANFDSTEIWIDLIIILDNSEAMGEESLKSAIGQIQSFLGDSFDDVLTTDVNAKFYTRVGLIAMSNTADIIYAFNMTKYDDLSEKVHIKTGVNDIDVMGAFQVAQKMFNDNYKSERSDVRQVIYYMTDANPQVNQQGLKQFKGSMGTIIVSDFVEEGGTESPGLKELASPGYYSSTMKDNYMYSIQMFCKANCYCLADKHAYKAGNTDEAILAGGGCIYANVAGYPWSRSQSSCASFGNKGLLVSVHNDDKNLFVTQVMRNASASANFYWIGYSKPDGVNWQWEDKSTEAYTHWDAYEPSPNSVAKCTYVDMSLSYWGAGNCQTGFPSVCEFPPCMAGNKC